MKKRIVSLFLILCLLFTAFPLLSFADGGMEIRILFTHDLHSHLEPMTTWEGEEIGGFARIGTAIRQAKEEDPATLAVDAGDFSMGTLYQSVYSAEAAELRMLGAMGIDATTLGNHEFDYRPTGLIEMLTTARESGDPLPVLLQSNIDWENSPGEHTDDLRRAMEAAGAKEYILLEKGGVEIALFGLMGKDADECAPTSELIFIEAAQAAKDTVAKIKEEADPDLIVCLSHSGTWSDPKKSEDELLAKAVPEIDVIISGHTHTRLDAPIVAGDTFIVSGGEYGSVLGSLALSRKEDGRWQLESYELIPMDTSVPEDPELLEKFAGYKESISEYLQLFGFTSPDQVLAYNPHVFPEGSKLSEVHGEQPLGNLIADSYRYAIKQAEGDSYRPVDVGVAPVGVIRESFRPGEITVSEVYEVSSLGIGADGISGYPLVSVYLTGKELYTLAEVDASVSLLMSAAQLHVSGLGFSYNPNRLILDRVTDVWLTDEDGNRVEIEEDKLYRVVSGLYSAQMLGTVNSKSFGLLSLVPKDAKGDPITDFEAHIITGENGSELKEWAALATYLSSFEKEDGVPVIPAMYGETLGRKVIEDDASLAARLANPGKISLMLYGVIAGLIAVIAAIVLVVRYILRRRRKKKV